jgi:hypothetical protein
LIPNFFTFLQKLLFLSQEVVKKKEGEGRRRGKLLQSAEIDKSLVNQTVPGWFMSWDKKQR